MLLVARVLGGDADSGRSGNSGGVADGENGKVVLKVAVAIARKATMSTVVLLPVTVAKPIATHHWRGTARALELWWKQGGGLDATAGLEPPRSWLQMQLTTR